MCIARANGFNRWCFLSGCEAKQTFVSMIATCSIINHCIQTFSQIHASTHNGKILCKKFTTDCTASEKFVHKLDRIDYMFEINFTFFLHVVTWCRQAIRCHQSCFFCKIYLYVHNYRELKKYAITCVRVIRNSSTKKPTSELNHKYYKNCRS